MDKEKELEKLMGKLFEADHLEAPSVDFTENILTKIETEKQSRFSYSPLLPKWVFGLIATLFGLSALYTVQMDGTDYDPFNLTKYISAPSDWFSNAFSQVGFSNALGYVVVAVGAMICVQATLLTKRFHRELA